MENISTKNLTKGKFHIDCYLPVPVLNWPVGKTESYIYYFCQFTGHSLRPKCSSGLLKDLYYKMGQLGYSEKDGVILRRYVSLEKLY